MRLLRQISLDGNILRHSSFSSSSSSKPFSEHSAERLGHNFARHLSDTINAAIVLLEDLSTGTLSFEACKVKSDSNSGKKLTKDGEHSNILKILEELNSLIVYLIRLSSDDSQKGTIAKEKSKSKLRRQYSAFVESGQFRRIRRSFSRQDSDNSMNGSPNSSPSPSSSPPNEEAASPLAQQHSANSLVALICGCSLEEAIQKLIESQVLSLLLQALPNIGFEEKKMVRIILTNSMILKVNKAHLVVDYICQPSTDILQSLVQSYEFARSDVTLNCGCILRFASQYESIVSSIVQSEYFYHFFEYMQRSPSCYPFDVAMDVFLTFKTILTRHKATVMTILQCNPVPFFDAFIGLLQHAEATENYVTKRQTLEIFADILSGDECAQFRSYFLLQDSYICPIIVYLWNRNLQIRLRCLVLLNQLFRMSSSKDGASAPIRSEQNASELDSGVRSRCNSKDNSEPICVSEWQLDLLLDKVIKARSAESSAKGKVVTDLEMYRWACDMFIELRSECSKSAIKHFTSQIWFVDQLVRLVQSMT